jgi:NAD(P)-dependent dehydrogenase (short-subunit alcohol dehydrogenase family)
VDPESHCAIVTGGESGIGRACALALAFLLMIAKPTFW